MSDDELRALERRWQESGARGDRERWLQGLARTRGLAPEWVELSLLLDDYDPAKLSAALVPIMTANPLGDAQDVAVARGTLLRDLQAGLRSATGRWFHQLTEDFDPPWCACHWLPRTAADVPRCMERIEAQVSAMHRHVRALLELAGAVSAEATSAANLVVAVGVRVVDQVVLATHCNETWYREVGRAMRLVLGCYGLPLDEQAEADLEHLIEITFGSWSTPRSEVRDWFVLELAAALERFDAR